ncbi:MAG: trypsin-like peptidase domain-containing protein [Candidatus Aminicenantes bacterium]|nr:MAG: trypsin-like peptidase domain-containing protein [Candidatus Aminicenantes bacterium]
MSDFFDENDYGEEEQKPKKNQNLIYVAGFIGVVLVIILLVLAIEESNRKTKRSKTTFKKVETKDSDKLPLYKKKKKPGTTSPGKTPDQRVEVIKPDNAAPTHPLYNKQCYLSVVRIITETRSGSGTLISSSGYFLTNAHVVGNSHFQLVYFSKNPKNPPVRYFTTQTVFMNESLDLAVLMVVSTAEGASLNHLKPAKIGNSSSLELGDEIHIYGYPGVGGQTITLTRGVISGFLQGASSWIKTDANISGGNSGGGAFNRKGEFIGVPTSGAVDQRMSSQLGMVRPIDAIKRYIAKYLSSAA